MVPRAESKPQVTWQSLNARQQEYLKAIYQADQEVEADEKSRWHRGQRSRAAEEWRWMVYATLDGYDTPVKRHIRATELIDTGTGSTLDALERRKLITVRYDITTYNGQEILSKDPIPTIQMTREGRALVRKALAIPRHPPVGTLHSWHWRALAKAYAAGDQAVSKEGGVHYAHIGWSTWLRLRDYQIKGVEYPLVEERGGIRITSFGRAYYERSFQRYHDLYPESEAMPPAQPVDPCVLYIEELQGRRTCRACQGEYLVAITRTYQQSPHWTWTVSEQEQRVAGVVTGRYPNIKYEQCICQDQDIQEISAPFLDLLERLSTEHWHLRFPKGHWIGYLEYLVNGPGQEGKTFYDPGLVKQKVLPLLDATDIPDDQNVVKGEMRYCYNERIGKGCIYSPASGPFRKVPVAVTRKEVEQLHAE